MLYDLSLLWILFIIYSFIGYIVEVIAISIENKKLTLSRGYLIGPIIPIFGLGAIFIILFLTRYTNELLTLFILSVVICSILEYITSYLMEKIFKLRWWDYSDRRFNINGRVSLDFAVLFGVGGVLMLKFAQPFLTGILLGIKPTTIYIVASVLAILFIIDFIISTNIIFKLKDNVHKLVKKDSTFKIKLEVRRALKERSLLTVRLIKAFPNMSLTKLNKIQKLVLDKKEYKELKEKRK